MKLNVPDLSQKRIVWGKEVEEILSAYPMVGQRDLEKGGDGVVERERQGSRVSYCTTSATAALCGENIGSKFNCQEKSR